MNKLARFIIGALFGLLVWVAQIATSNVVFAAAPDSPTISPNSGIYGAAQIVTITPDHNTYITGYTTDGSEPEVSCTAGSCTSGPNTSTVYDDNAFSIGVDGADGVTVMVRAKSFDEDGAAEATSVKNYTFDKNAPVITVNGANPLTVEAKTPYNEPGFSVTDTSGNVVTWVDGNLNTGVVGSYVVVYHAQDPFGRGSQATRTVNVVDTTPPTLTIVGASDVTIEVGSAYNDLGATATDLYDGNITSSIVVTNNVNPNIIGNYTVTYTVTDSNGNSTTVIRYVHVVDTTPPVVTINGASDVTIEVHSSYTELGATSIDGYDGDITAGITISGSVDIHTVGTYVLTYRSVDSSGNITIVTRMVHVVDTTDPVITLNGSSDITIEVHTAFSDPGATALDNYDGNITAWILVSGSVDIHTVGIYTLTYQVTDSNGNSAQVIRTVRVVDTTPPTVTMIGPATIDLEVGDTYVEYGATAVDNYDGPVTVTILGIVDTGEPGVYLIIYVATDAHGNTSFVTRTVNVSDTTDPVITLIGATDVFVEVGSPYVEPGWTAFDNYDGDITSWVLVSGSVDIHTVGVYVLTYIVTDSHGNTSVVIRRVHVVDTTPPVVTIIGANPITIEVGTPYVEGGATAFDNYDGDITGSIVITGTVNWNVVGTYTITYTVTDANGNVTVVTRTINVVDTTPPVITVVGGNPITIEVGTPFTDPGATAFDNYDGNITSLILVSGSVNWNVVGTYVLTYQVTDANGNTSIVTRTVKVLDTTKPVISLNGSSEITINQGGTYTELGAKATDNYDGDITGKIVVSGTVDTSKAGTYSITYCVTDSNGNTSCVTRTVRVLALPAVLSSISETALAQEETNEVAGQTSGENQGEIKSGQSDENKDQQKKDEGKQSSLSIFGIILLLILLIVGIYLLYLQSPELLQRLMFWKKKE